MSALNFVMPTSSSRMRCVLVEFAFGYSAEVSQCWIYLSGSNTPEIP
jgi:hypothetical protein